MSKSQKPVHLRRLAKMTPQQRQAKIKKHQRRFTDLVSADLELQDSLAPAVITGLWNKIQKHPGADRATFDRLVAQDQLRRAQSSASGPKPWSKRRPETDESEIGIGA